MSSTAIRQQIIQSLANLSDEQLLQIRELIDQNFLLQIKPKSEEEIQQLIKSLRFFRTYTVENSSSSRSAQQCSKVDKYQSNKNSKP
ncbi:hypothetical protein [Microcystis aeruginosa]|uniref:hypothetical protein n=1 Tax=Microcystis aeruginosa TaxID=1126 RepID=UPI00232FCF2E|nr:hypothetical protein [Microcystis aeruginosa]MDB9412788.1 hypothetical protein [Microcystis aeruginosa CS-567/02]